MDRKDVDYAYSLWELRTQGNGELRGTCSTNDDLDSGDVSEYAKWDEHYPDLATALKRTNGTHQGVGHWCEVWIDGHCVDGQGQEVISRFLDVLGL